MIRQGIGVIGVAAVLLLGGQVALGDTGWTRPRFAVPVAEAAPLIDGELSDPCWKNALKAGEFVRFTGGAPLTEQTEAWITSDSTFLYVAFYCHDTHPELIRASETQRGSQAVFSDDHISVIIDSQNTRRNTSSFSVNALGTQLDQLEGGTADNITWAGDWRAAVKNVPDGWVCELAIPFKMLRHPPRSRAFGLQLSRFMTREANQMVWPGVPPEGQSFFARVQFFPELVLPKPIPDQAPRPVFLPYLLSTARTDGAAGRQGMDIKYPFSTTLTGLLAVSPDFRTIEQDVASVSFSYNEQFVPDRRPFFAEGSEFLPERELFYSRRIESFDEGIKVVGRSGPTSVGFLTTGQQAALTGQNAAALSLRQAVGLNSDYGVSMVGNNRIGSPDNRVLRAYGSYGWNQAGRRNFIFTNRSQSWVAQQPRGGASTLGFFSSGQPGKPRFFVGRNILSADFVTDLGLVQDLNRQGYSANIGQRNQFDRGWLQQYDVNLEYNRFDRLAGGGFFREDVGWDSRLQTREGYGLNLSVSRGRRLDSVLYQDQFTGGGLGWNQRTLFQGGGFFVGSGRQAGEATRFLNVYQGVLMTRPFSARLSYSQQVRGSETNRQLIITGTYRLSTTQTLSSRLLVQDGTGNASNVGASSVRNVYVAFAQRVRSGADAFVILGDPNAARTQAQVTVKLIRPY